MLERFTDRARKVMALANTEAIRFHHEHVNTEHIVLGLINEGSNAGVNILRCLGIDPRRVRAEIERRVTSGPKPATGRLPVTAEVARVIQYAVEESRDAGQDYVATEHLLLGLLRRQDGMAAQVLMSFGLKPEDVRAAATTFRGEEEPAFRGPPSHAPAAIPGVGTTPAPQPPPEPSRADGTPFDEFLKDDAAGKLIQGLVRELDRRKDAAVQDAEYDLASEYRDLMESAKDLLDRLGSLLARGSPPTPPPQE
jgi:ATP-dependent Clp protease ATP-binding subunit ClpA